MSCKLLVSLGLLTGCTPSFSQAQSASSFEVADVRINKSGEVRMAVDMAPGGKLTMHNVPMRVMLMLAYHVRADALVDAPAWIGADRFDVVAKAPETASPDEMRRMLQALLAERFKLVVHTDQKVMPSFALIVGKSGAKMEPVPGALLSEQGCPPGPGAPGQRHVICRSTTMAMLADSLQEMSPSDFPVPVVDQTGLRGAYSFKLDWTPTPRPANGNAAKFRAPSHLSGTAAGADFVRCHRNTARAEAGEQEASPPRDHHRSPRTGAGRKLKVSDSTAANGTRPSLPRCAPTAHHRPARDGSTSFLRSLWLARVP